jgi:hypothetical protein
MKKLSVVIEKYYYYKVGWNTTFVGELVREVLDLDANYRLTVLFHGSVVINEGKIWCVGKNQEKLEENLNVIATMKLDGNLHGDEGKYIYLGLSTPTVSYDDDADKFYLN